MGLQQCSVTPLGSSEGLISVRAPPQCWAVVGFQHAAALMGSNGHSIFFSEALDF